MAGKDGAGAKKTQPGPQPKVDRCWYVAVTCSLAAFLTSATGRASGYIYIGIMREFNLDRGQSAWPIFLIGITGSMAGLVSGPLCQMYTPPPVMLAGGVMMAGGVIASSFAPSITWMSVTLGGIFGIGSGLLFMTLPIYVNQYFEKYRGFALGITYAGSTSSAFVFPRLLLFLEEEYSFRGSLLIFGAIIGHIVAVSLILKEPPWIQSQRAEDKQASKRTKEVFAVDRATAELASSATAENTIQGMNTGTSLKTKDKNPVNSWSLRHGLTVLKIPMFYVVLMTYCTFYYIFDVFVATNVDFAMDRGASMESAVGLIPLYAITDTFGRLFTPLLADRGYVSRSCLAMLTYLWMGTVMLCFPVLRGYYQLLVAYMLLATALGCGVTLYPLLMADYVGIQRLPISYGIVGAVAGPLFVAKPFFIGYFRDKLGSYDNMYRLLSLSVLPLGLVWLGVSVSEGRKRKRWQPTVVGHVGTMVGGADAAYCNMGFTLKEPSCYEDTDADQEGNKNVQIARKA